LIAARAATALALVAALAVSACGGSDDDEPRRGSAPVENTAARRFVEAVNSGSATRVMATLTADAIVIDGGRRFDDTAAIREWLDAEVTGVHGRITVRGEQPSSDGTVLTVDFRSSAFRGSELRYAFVTRSDRVAELTLGG
jgi:ABC-type glycerol-3-phosphate transport system substrate-binding protein